MEFSRITFEQLISHSTIQIQLRKYSLNPTQSSWYVNVLHAVQQRRVIEEQTRGGWARRRLAISTLQFLNYTPGLMAI